MRTELSLKENKTKVHNYCNTRGCHNCKLNKICNSLKQERNETVKEWEQRFYKIMANAI